MITYTLPWSYPPPFDPDDTGTEVGPEASMLWRHYTAPQWAREKLVSTMTAIWQLRGLVDEGRAEDIGRIAGLVTWKVRIR